MAKQEATVDTTGDGERPNSQHSVVKYWLSEIDASKKREKDFRKDGQRILNIYNADNPDKTPFNILFSNTETLLPALYSAIPRPVVQRRFKDEDPLGKSAAMAGQRILEFLMDTNVDGYETFDGGVRSATLDGLLPGRGVTCVKYDAEIGQMDRAGDEDEPTDYKKSELVCVDTKPWNRVYFGYAKKWSKVPWVAYEEYVDRKEAVRLFGEEVSEKLIYTENEPGDKDDNETREQEKNQGERRTVCVYQIWDKDGGRKIRYISASYPDGYLKEEDDPLELTGFFNCPKPLQFVEKSNDLLPTAPYLIYENQAREINRLTIRINKIVEAIKARGAYDTELGDALGSIMDADDNALVPTDKSSALAAEKGLSNAIWFMPLDVLINVLGQLYVAREKCKNVIYEITGISDILRGSSLASETATAQNIKAQWGTLRLKRLQREVQRYARDILRMMLECATYKFSEETWAKMTGLPFLLGDQFNELTAISSALQQRAQAEQIQIRMQSQAQPGQPNGQSQPQPSITPTMQQLRQVQAQLQSPKWSDVLAMLRDDMQRAYRIDIETNSTVEPEAVEDQKNIADLMNALGQYLNGVGPLVAKGVMPFEVAQSMLLAITRRFRFGSEIEEYVKGMQAPKPEQDGSGLEKERMQLEMQARSAEIQANKAMEQAKLQITQQTEASKLQLQSQIEQLRLEQEKRANQAKLQSEKNIEQMRASLLSETELRKAEIQAATQLEIARINAASRPASQ